MNLDTKLIYMNSCIHYWLMPFYKCFLLKILSGYIPETSQFCQIKFGSKIFLKIIYTNFVANLEGYDNKCHSGVMAPANVGYFVT